jgi:hypothetical protein
MVAFPIRTSLYRSALWVVICAAVSFSLAQIAPAQIARKSKRDAGPRALGLVELSSEGKARLIPVCIMIDGKFYDAGAYKASPVPLALWTDTVYEGEKTGVPQGLFTVAEAGHNGNDVWFGVGKWTPGGSDSGAHSKDKGKGKGKDSKPKLDGDEGPPKLRRPEIEKPSDSGAPSSDKPASVPQDNKAPSTSAGTASPPTTDNPASPTPASPDDEKKPDNTSSAANDEDPNRPILKRGQPETERMERPLVGASTGVPRKPVTPPSAGTAKKSSPQLLPAISDAGGPDPRPYTYELKPAEEEKYRKGMLALAADAFAAKLRELAPAPASTGSSTRKPARRPPTKASQPTFDDVQFRAFDLWNTNEPVFVLSATAKAPPSSTTSTENPDQKYYVTVVAKNNIYDELRRLYAGVTDARHLDVTPRLELIDAVDADGDGRGELLFRSTSDVGKAWAVYRAGADQLFPLFEGTPPENKPPSE